MKDFKFYVEKYGLSETADGMTFEEFIREVGFEELVDLKVEEMYSAGSSANELRDMVAALFERCYTLLAPEERLRLAPLYGPVEKGAAKFLRSSDEYHLQTADLHGLICTRSAEARSMGIPEEEIRKESRKLVEKYLDRALNEYAELYKKIGMSEEEIEAKLEEDRLDFSMYGGGWEKIKREG